VFGCKKENTKLEDGREQQNVQIRENALCMIQLQRYQGERDERDI
jgi:hypothetical protein